MVTHNVHLPKWTDGWLVSNIQWGGDGGDLSAWSLRCTTEQSVDLASPRDLEVKARSTFCFEWQVDVSIT